MGVRGVAAVAIVLAAVAGFVDLVGWLALAHVYSANMTGNTIHLAQGLAQGRTTEAVCRAWPILCFVLGLFASELSYELMRLRGAPAGASLALGLEALLLALVVVTMPLGPGVEVAAGAGARYFVPVGLLSAAMGLQNASLVRVGASSLYTTHVTGNLTRLAREAARWTVARDRAAEPARSSGRRALFMAVMWSSYVAGSMLGLVGRDAIGLRALVAPLAVLLALVVLDRVRPIGGHDTPEEPHPIF